MEVTVFFLSGLDGLPLPPALGVKVLDSWKDQQSNKATRLQATLGVGPMLLDDDSKSDDPSLNILKAKNKAYIAARISICCN